MSMSWVIVTDANGVDFHALSDNADKEEGVTAWVFTDKESGFGVDVGNVNMIRNLKRRPDGKFGA